MTLAGSGTLVLAGAGGGLSGPITINSGRCSSTQPIISTPPAAARPSGFRGLLDISGSSGVSFGTGGSVSVNAGALRIGNGVFGTSATTPINVTSGAELQYSGNGGSMFNDPIQGAGVFHLVSGTVQLTGTNTYTGGTCSRSGPRST